LSYALVPAGFEPTIPLYERGVIANLTMGLRKGASVPPAADGGGGGGPLNKVKNAKAVWIGDFGTKLAPSLIYSCFRFRIGFASQ